MNKTAVSTLADNIVAQFKYEFPANEVYDVAIPEDSILKEAALRTISREIADGSIRKKALNELKERDERSYDMFAKYTRYPECPVVPENFKIEEGDGSALFYPTFTVEKCMEIMLQHAYRIWINEHADRNIGRLQEERHKTINKNSIADRILCIADGIDTTDLASTPLARDAIDDWFRYHNTHSFDSDDLNYLGITPNSSDQEIKEAIIEDWKAEIEELRDEIEFQIKCDLDIINPEYK